MVLGFAYRAKASSEFLVTSNPSSGNLCALAGQGGLLAQSWDKLSLLLESTWNCAGGSPKLKQRSLCSNLLLLQSPGHWDAELLGSINAYRPRDFSKKVPYPCHCSQCLSEYARPWHTHSSRQWPLCSETLTTQSLLLLQNHWGPKKRRGVVLASLGLYQPQNACQAAVDVPTSCQSYSTQDKWFLSGKGEAIWWC